MPFFTFQSLMFPAWFSGHYHGQEERTADIPRKWNETLGLLEHFLGICVKTSSGAIQIIFASFFSRSRYAHRLIYTSKQTKSSSLESLWRLLKNITWTRKTWIKYDPNMTKTSRVWLQPPPPPYTHHCFGVSPIPWNCEVKTRVGGKCCCFPKFSFPKSFWSNLGNWG